MGRAMSRAFILVIDGLGVGAMPDAHHMRPGDDRSDTLGHVLAHARGTGRPVMLPGLDALGLPLLRFGTFALPGRYATAAGRARLGYPGADTFAGHQTLMGADMSRLRPAVFAGWRDRVAAALATRGHAVRAAGGNLPALLVDDTVVVGDNLEADPGLNWNASGRLDDLPFSAILTIAREVRELAPVARVIAVGGHSDQPLTRYVRTGEHGTAGLDTPASGFYRNPGLEVTHLGIPIDTGRQLPALTRAAGHDVTLIGKAADILTADNADSRPGVDTTHVVDAFLDTISNQPDGLVVANVQETDLAGHQQNPAAFGAVLQLVDQAIVDATTRLRRGDLLIVTADHGNDPSIGHPYHTREHAPVLITGWNASRPVGLRDADSLADIAATAALHLNLDPSALAAGTPLTSRATTTGR